MKFPHISKSNTRYCVLHVATITLFWFVTFIHTYTYTYTYARTHTHTHTHANLKFAIFWNDRELHTQAITIMVHKIQYMRNLIFILKTSDLRKHSGQIERNKLKYLHYLIKMITKNARWANSFLVKLHVSSLQLY